MLDRKKSGTVQTVTLYKQNGNFDQQMSAVKAALCDMMPTNCTLVSSDNIETAGEHATFTFEIREHASLTPSQRRHIDLLKEHEYVNYITSLMYVMVEKNGVQMLDFEGSFRKVSKKGFDRRALENLATLGLVEVVTGQKIFGDFPHDESEGSGFYICETYRLAK
tara:strand:- start:396 stop:890 length:495 start_codon:yes stop_codon:yes gene_type:complete